VSFSAIRLTVFPLGLKISDLDSIEFPGLAKASFSGIDAVVHFKSLFTRRIRVSLIVREPVVDLEQGWQQVLKSSQERLASSLRLQSLEIINGTLSFQFNEITVKAGNVNARISLGKKEERRFFLQVPALFFSLPVFGEEIEFNGHLIADVLEQRHSYKINRLAFQEEGFFLETEGRFYKDNSFYLNSRTHGDPSKILHPLLDEFTPQAQLKAALLLQRNREGNVSVAGNFSAPSFSINQESFNDLIGEASWNDQDKMIELTAGFLAPEGPATVRVSVDSTQVRLDVDNIPAGQIAGLLEISAEIPVEGMIKTGRVYFRDGKIEGKALLEPIGSNGEPGLPFHFTGSVNFQHDQLTKITVFSSDNLLFAEGALSLKGRVDEAERTVELNLQGESSGVENLLPYLRYYLDLDLDPWVLRGGQNRFSIDLRESDNQLEVEADILCLDFSAQGAGIKALRGRVENHGLKTSGFFTLEDDALQGKARLSRQGETLLIEFPAVKGEAAKALRILDIDLDIRGFFQGAFSYLHRGEDRLPEINGAFQADNLVFYSLPLTDTRFDLFSDTDEIRLSDTFFTFYGGRGQASLGLDFSKRIYNLDVELQAIDISRINHELKGIVDVSAKGSGFFLIDPIEVNMSGTNLSYYQDRPFSLRAKSTILTDFDNYNLQLNSTLEDENTRAAASLKLKYTAGSYDGSFECFFPDLDLLMPWTNNEGELRIIGQLTNEGEKRLGNHGVAVFKGKSLSIPNFSHALEDFSGHITFRDFDFSMRSLRGTMGGGIIEGNGRLQLLDGRVEDFAINFNGRNMNLYPMDRVACELNGELTLKLVQDEFLLQGQLHFLSTRWQREIDEDVLFYTNPQLTPAESRFLEMLRFDIRLSGTENTLIENYFVQGRGSFNLLLAGSPDFPLLTGTIDGQQGFITFADRQFNILKARIAFNNKFFIDPMINLEAEAFIQNYRVIFKVTGTASRPRPEFISSPPLPPSDVLALVSLGEIFRRWRSTEISSQIGTAALITGKLSEEFRQRAGKLFGIDLFRLDALFTGQPSLNTSRLTVGKSLARDLIFVYSTNLYTLKQEIIYIKFQLSPAVSLIGMKNEEGRFSVDVQFRKRY